ncbi:MAG: GNAT family N-acetyltransferase [Azoarcus sp.]|nr:GNAT family N-acetyltransferase [Azoarcus sp.]
MSRVRYRRMSFADLAEVMVVQSEAYGDGFIENIEVIAARLEAAPDTAWVAEDRTGVCAYLVGYPSLEGRMTALGGAFSVAGEPDCLYLHDLAVSPRVAGRRVGPSLVHMALAFAQAVRFTSSSLVSVQASKAFWQRQGYGVVSPDPQESAKLDSYPGAAVYMARRLRS